MNLFYKEAIQKILIFRSCLDNELDLYQNLLCNLQTDKVRAGLLL